MKHMRLVIGVLLSLLIIPLVQSVSGGVWVDLSATDSGNWAGTNTIFSVFYDADNNVVWTGLVGGKFGYYNISSGVWVDLSATDSGDWVGTSRVSFVFYDVDNNVVWTGIDGGKLGYYNISSGVWVDLSATDSGNWVGTSGVNSVFYDADNNVVWTAIITGKFGYYNISSGVWVDLSATDSGNWVGTSRVNSVFYDADNNVVWTSTDGGKLGYYNISSGVWVDLSATDSGNWVGTSIVASVLYDADNNVVWTGLGNKKFGYYNISSGEWVDLSATAVDNWTTPLHGSAQQKAIYYDNDNKVVWLGTFGAGLSAFSYYDLSTNEWVDLSATDSGDWVGNSGVHSVFYDADNNVVWTGIEGGKFGYYELPQIFYEINGTIYCPDASPGDIGEVNGTNYTAVNNSMLYAMNYLTDDYTIICTSLVTQMNNLFKDKSFNQNISSWDTSSVTTMQYMFGQDNVFGGRLPFNQDISRWNVGKVSNFANMFSNVAFNQPIGAWNIGETATNINMYRMFWASTFNQPIGSWNMSKVISMQGMFQGVIPGVGTRGKSVFNQDISSWDVSKVTGMDYLFEYSQFNQNISGWNTASLLTMPGLFYDNDVFNYSLDSWNVSKVNDMQSAFAEGGYDKPLNSWDVRSVTQFQRMFQNSKFNQPLDNWQMRTTGGINFEEMFRGSKFNQPIGSWNINRGSNFANMFTASSLNKTNWDNILLGWVQSPPPTTRTITSPAQYSYLSFDARKTFTTTYAWTINDGGFDGNFPVVYDSRIPSATEQNILTYETINLSILVNNLENITISYYWSLNGDSVGDNSSNYSFVGSYATYGANNISVSVIGLATNITTSWLVNVGIRNVTLQSRSPNATEQSVFTYESLGFSVNITNEENLTLEYEWMLNNAPVGTNSSTYLYNSTTYLDAGKSDNLSVVITSPTLPTAVNITTSWLVNVTRGSETIINHVVEETTITSIKIRWFGSPDSVRLYNNGVFVAETTDIRYTITGLAPNTAYNITLVPKKTGVYGVPYTIVASTASTNNNPPVLQEAFINPTSGVTDTIFSGSCRATDIDSQKVFYSYDWLVNNVSVKSGTTGLVTQGVTTSIGSLLNTFYNKGDTLSLICSANDGISTSNNASASVLIQNKQAQISEIFLIQFNTTDYICNHTYIDADNDPEITPSYKWFKNDVLSNVTTINSAIDDYVTGDRIMCQVTTGDGIAANVTANSSTFVVGDMVAPVLSITKLGTKVFTDSVLDVQAVCSDDIGVAGGFPVLRFINPNLEQQQYSLFYDMADKYYRYLTLPIAGTYTNVVMQCCDGNGNCVSQSWFDIVSEVRTTTIVVNQGGGGGATEAEPFRDIVSFEIIPKSVNYNIPAGNTIIGEVEIINTDIVPLSFVLAVLRDETTPITYEWISFDGQRRTDAFIIQPKGGLVSSSRFMSYIVKVPRETPVGRYSGIIEVVSGEQTEQFVITINVREPGAGLLGFLNYELFVIPGVQSIITGDTITDNIDAPSGRSVTIGVLLLFIVGVTALVFVGKAVIGWVSR